MKPAPFAYHAPASVDKALTLLRAHPQSRPLAGGQSLVPMLALRLAQPEMLIDLNRVAGLSDIKHAGDALVIGAMTRQQAALRSPVLAQHAPLLIEALRHVGHPPTRARGTIGGSLAHADPAAELPAAMLALDATMIARAQDGERRIPAAEFFLGAFETALLAGELLVAIEVPMRRGGSAFLELSPRPGDFAIISAAAHVELAPDGTCGSCALVLGGVADRPLRCAEAESMLLGQPLGQDSLMRAMAALPLTAITMHSPLATGAYRRRIAPVLARRALEAAAKAQA